MRYAIRKLKSGFTLVELMIVVAIVGVLAVLAIYGVRKYIANSKTTEARNSLGQISKDAATALERESGASAPQAAGGATLITRQLCKTSTSIPTAMSSVQGGKYQSAAGEWSAGDQTTGWNCLKFSLEQPQYYQYTYGSTGGATNGSTFTAVAQGDLNGDGATYSTFSVAGSIQGGSLSTSPTIYENLPEE